jgi:transposase
VFQAPKLEPWIVRYELSDSEWATIKPLLPNKSRGVRRVNDRRVLNGIFWVLRSGAPWRDLPVCYGPRTTCYNRFVRWRRAMRGLAFWTLFFRIETRRSAPRSQFPLRLDLILASPILTFIEGFIAIPYIV